MSANDIQSLQITVLSLNAKVEKLEKAIEELKSSSVQQAEITQVKRSKSSGVSKVKKPANCPKEPTPVHHQFTKMLESSGEIAKITEDLKSKFANESDLKKEVKKAISILFAKEKGHVAFDADGKPTDKLADESKYTPRVKKLFEDFRKAKEDAKKLKIEFEKTPEGMEYVKEKKEKSGEKASTKTSTKSPKKDVKTDNAVQVDTAFQDLIGSI